jgi:hypothetical protein
VRIVGRAAGDHRSGIACHGRNRILCDGRRAAKAGMLAEEP